MKYSLTIVCFMLAVAGCGPSYPVVKDYCPKLGRALTDEERVLKGLEYLYNEDERMLRDFPKGAKFSDYIGKKGPQPPYIPLHFQARKREAQIHSSSLKSGDFLKIYYKEFPDCCEVVEPAYRREKWDYKYFYYNVGKDTKWIKDVWVKNTYPFVKIENFNLGSYEKTSFSELRSDVCGEADNLKDERG